MDSVLVSHKKLLHLFQEAGECSIAVSGGVDSMTLAAIAHSVLGESARLFHASSPAVPTSVDERLSRYATQNSWNLVRIDAGELNDASYCLNPVTRCYHCKKNLYRSIRAISGDTVSLFSGTNLDDLSDYRPGLKAAEEQGVRHPYVECAIDKDLVRRLAAQIGLDEFSTLSASPCLSSRIETGISIEPGLLWMVDKIEMDIRERVSASNVRCRIRHQGVVLEVDTDYIAELEQDQEFISGLEGICVENRVQFLGIEDYQMGSAFVTVE